MNLKLRQLLVFLVLMQDLENKAPSYILEKSKAVNLNQPEGLLDYRNMERLLNYIETWKISEEYTQEELDAMRREVEAGKAMFGVTNA